MKVRRQLLRLLLLLRPQQQLLLLAVPSPSRRRDDARRPAMACKGATRQVVWLRASPARACLGVWWKDAGSFVVVSVVSVCIPRLAKPPAWKVNQVVKQGWGGGRRS